MIHSRRLAAGTLPPVLPPSVEEAYKKKCIELKRRLTEVQESNDAFRLRKVRLNRAIRKMRLERALLLENLGKRMRKNGSRLNRVFDEDSEGSSDQPPTPIERPLRIKRPHRRPASPPMLQTQLSLPRMSSNAQLAIYPNSSPHPLAPHPQPQPQPYLSALPSNGTPTIPLHAQPHPNPLAVSQYLPMAIPHPRPDPPPSAIVNHSFAPQHPPFPHDEFIETVWMSRPQDHPECRSVAQLREGGEQQWRDLTQAGLTEEWQMQYNRRMQQHEYEKDAWKKRNRRDVRGRSGSGMEEGEGEGNMSGGGSGVGGGGFTAVNQ